MKYSTLLLITIMPLLSFSNCKKAKVVPVVVIVPPSPTTYPIDIWTTNADQSALLQSRTAAFAAAKDDRFSVITVDSTQKLQTMDGFGYTLTGGSAYLINQLNTNAKAALLQELFSNKTNAIGVSYLRVSIGASE